MRTVVYLVIVSALVVAGCEDQSEFEREKAELMAELQARDEFINDVTSSISEIHNRLEAVWAEEKNIMRKSETVEGGKAMTAAEAKERALKRIAEISDVLAENRKKVKNLQARLAKSRLQYSGLEKMVDDLKSQLEEREQSVAALQTRVMNLESEVAEKVQVIAARDVTIANQARQLSGVFYIAGPEDELEEKGIITEEGGFLWGLLGSTNVLAPNFPEHEFFSLDRLKDDRIEVAGEIEELVPRRNGDTYQIEKSEGGRTLLKILNPEAFWQQKHLAIIADPTE